MTGRVLTTHRNLRWFDRHHPENEAYRYAQHAYCSYECFGHDIGF